MYKNMNENTYIGTIKDHKLMPEPYLIMILWTTVAQINKLKKQ